MRITVAMLLDAVNRLNQLAGTPTEFMCGEVMNKHPSPLHFYVERRRGHGVRLQQNGSGALHDVEDVFQCGYVNIKRLYSMVTCYALAIDHIRSVPGRFPAVQQPPWKR